MPKPNSADRTVAVIVYDGLCTFEFGIVAEIFGLDRPEMGADWYRLVTCAAEPGPLRAAGGITIATDAGLDRLADAGTIIVPGWKALDAPPPEPLVAALRQAAARGARIVSLCSGAFVLAAAGLLDECQATTHWRYIEAFKAAFPRVHVDPDVLYVDGGQMLTSAGSAAGIDLLLHIVRSDFGPDAANSVARRLVMPAHRSGGQAQFIERPVPAQPQGKLAPLLDAMRQRIDRPMTIAALARQAAMSERTFLRRFRDMTGTTPAEWLLALRLDHAKQLLEAGDARIDDVAAAAGFGSAATLRLHFRSLVGISPREYRQRFAHDRSRAGKPRGPSGSRRSSDSVSVAAA